MFTRSVSPMYAPDEPTYLEINFEQGNPVGINGQRLRPATLLTALNEVPAPAHSLCACTAFSSPACIAGADHAGTM